MKRLQFLFFAIILLNSSLLQAQSLSIIPGSLKMTVNGRTYADTAVVPLRYGDSVIYECTVINLDTAAFQGVVDLGIEGAVRGRPDTLLGPNQPLLLLAPSDSARLSFGDSIDVSVLRYSHDGVIIVVVWPTVRGQMNRPVKDSSRITIDIARPASISEAWENALIQIKLGPNPTFSTIFLDYGKVQKDVESVIISDLNGKLMQQQLGCPKQIDLSTLSSGIYMLRIRGKKGEEAVFKIQKF